jgi:Protein of unknown function (DUF1573)
LFFGVLTTYRLFHPPLLLGRHLLIPAKPVDFGLINTDVHATTQFMIRNGGTQPLNISDVAADCGCTVTSIDKKLLNPGESTLIHVIFNSSGYWREIQKRVLIISDDSDQAVKTVYLIGYVKIGVHSNTQWLDMGHGKFGQLLAPQNVIIYADSDFPSTRVDLTGDISGFTWNVTNWHPDQEAQSCTLNIALMPITQEPGTYTRNLQIQVGAKQMSLTIVYQVQPTISCTPAIVSIPLHQTNNADGLVTLNYGSQRINIDSISTSFNTCGVKMLSDSTDEARINIIPTVAEIKKATDDFDIVHVNYELAANGHKETLNIPVTFTQ